MVELVFAQYRAALAKLRVISFPVSDEIVRDAAIQRFEIVFELAWKLLKRQLEELGVLCQNPRSCIRSAWQQGILTDEEVWLAMLRGRNLTTHTYVEAVAIQLMQQLPLYIAHFEQLATKIETELRDLKNGE